MHQRNFHLQRMDSFLRGHLSQKGAHLDGDIVRPSLTISRQCGTRCDRIRRELVEYLDSIDESSVHGWASFDQSLIGKLIEEQVLRRLPVDFDPANSRMRLSPKLERTLQLRPEDRTLFNHSANTIRSLCDLGNAIILGRAGNFVTSDLPNTFHVRLVGTDEVRREYTRKRYDLNQKGSETLMREVDRARENFVRRFADSDITDSSFYHLVINTDYISDEILVRIIADSMIEWAQREFAEGINITPMPIHS